MLVEAFAAAQGTDGKRFVQIFAHANHEFSRVVFSRSRLRKWHPIFFIDLNFLYYSSITIVNSGCMEFPRERREIAGPTALTFCGFYMYPALAGLAGRAGVSRAVGPVSVVGRKKYSVTMRRSELDGLCPGVKRSFYSQGCGSEAAAFAEHQKDSNIITPFN
jgi:hypothetical protein